MLILGLAGHAGTGKDFLCEQIIKNYPEYRFHRYALADFLKELMCVVLDMSMEEINERKGDKDFRQRLIDFSELGIKKVDHEFWIKKFWKDAQQKRRNYIITDLRYHEELHFMEKLHGKDNVVFFSTYVKRVHAGVYRHCGMQIAPFQCDTYIDHIDISNLERYKDNLRQLIRTVNRAVSASCIRA